MLTELFTRAKALISDESRWTQGSSARDEHDCVIGCFNAHAVKFCAVGSIWRVAEEMVLTGHQINDATKILHKHVPPDHSMVSVNDRLGHAEVMKMFDRAIQEVQNEQGSEAAEVHPRATERQS